MIEGCLVSSSIFPELSLSYIYTSISQCIDPLISTTHCIKIVSHCKLDVRIITERDEHVLENEVTSIYERSIVSMIYYTHFYDRTYDISYT